MTILHMPARPICKKHNIPKRVTKLGNYYCKSCAREYQQKSTQRRKEKRASMRPYVKQLLENFGRIA